MGFGNKLCQSERSGTRGLKPQILADGDAALKGPFFHGADAAGGSPALRQKPAKNKRAASLRSLLLACTLPRYLPYELLVQRVEGQDARFGQ
jgi:hypothetical protein